MRAEFDPQALLEVLVRHRVDFVVIGGIAAGALGAARATYDLDVAYSREQGNLERLAEALGEVDASLRGAPADVPFLLDAATLERGLNFTFMTRFGSLDILGEPAGAPLYRDLRGGSTLVDLYGFSVRVASIDHLIAMKEAAGRPRDLTDASELRAISDELRAT